MTAPPPGEASSFGYFLAGQAAESYGQTGFAADLYAHAAALGPQGSRFYLNGQAFIAAVLAGDMSRAAVLAPEGPDADPDLVKLGALVHGVEDLATGRGQNARAALTASEGGAATRTAAALLLPFAAAEARDTEASVAQPVIPGAPVAQFYARLDQGLLFEHARRYEEAETAYRDLVVKGDPEGLASLALGAMLERRGRGADAVAVYVAALRRLPGDQELLSAWRRASAHQAAPPQPSLRQSAALALIAPAAVMISQKSDDVAMAYLRLALWLDPAQDEAWILVGDVLAAEGDTTSARAAYARLSPGSPHYVEGELKLAWSFQESGDDSQALAVTEALAAAHPKDHDILVSLADMLRSSGRYADSAKILDGLIAGDEGRPDWRLLYMRAVDSEESGDWASAESDLTRALGLHPDEPELLNFLGYSWIDRGEKLPQALAMVKKAVSLDPHSGAMIDSLGWGYYRLGDYAKAVEKLEQAILLEPGDPDVNDHLGDAYWRVGRKLEAQFQWRRVLTLDPSAKLRTAVETKLKAGLTDPGPDLVAEQQAHGL